MKIAGIAGILLFLFGGLVLIIGAIVCLNTWNSDYATSACRQAAQDQEKFAEAKETCGSTTSDCYRLKTVGLISEDECEAKTAYMHKQMLMGAVPAGIGLLIGGIGLILAIVGFVFGRKRKAVATT